MVKQHYTHSVSEEQRKRFSRFLSEDEELVLITGFGTIYLRQMFLIFIGFPGVIFVILGAVLAFITKFEIVYGMALGILPAIGWALMRVYFMNKANKYLLTTRRVIKKGGFFSVELASALYDKITHIEVRQGFIDRYFMHHGTIIVNTAGANKDEIVLKYVDYPIEFKNILERLINREREHFGKGTGPVESLEGELVED